MKIKRKILNLNWYIYALIFVLCLCIVCIGYYNKSLYLKKTKYVYNESNIDQKTSCAPLLARSLPEANIITNDDGSVLITWDDDSYSGKLNGKVYVRGTLIKEEGKYIFIIVNAIGQTRPYSFTIGHNYVITEIKPTCLEDGYTNHQCSFCNDLYKTDIIKAKGHQFTDCVIPASCIKSGYINHVCTVCNYEYQSDITYATGHSYVNTIVAAATCTENGLRKHNCEKCGDEYDSMIPAMKHNYSITDINTSDGVTRRTYTCTVCGESYTQDLGNQYEKVTSYVEYLFTLYSPYMFWVFLSTAGVWSVVLGVMIIIAHKNEDKEKARKMLINYAIGLVIIAVILVVCPFLVQGIAALIS